DDRRLAAFSVRVALVVGLEVAERERRLLPLVEAKRRGAGVGGLFKQGFVEAHVPGAVERGIDDQSAGRHLLQLSHAKARRRKGMHLVSGISSLRLRAFA